MFCSIRIDACKCVDRSSRAEEPGEEGEGEVDPGQETRNNHVGLVESEDEVQPMIKKKKRQRKSQSSGNGPQGFYLRCFSLTSFEHQAPVVKREITRLGSIRVICGSFSCLCSYIAGGRLRRRMHSPVPWIMLTRRKWHSMSRSRRLSGEGVRG